MDDHYYNAMVLLRDRLLTKALLILFDAVYSFSSY